MSIDLFVFGLSILTVVALIVLVLTSEGKGRRGDDND